MSQTKWNLLPRGVFDSLKVHTLGDEFIDFENLFSNHGPREVHVKEKTVEKISLL